MISTLKPQKLAFLIFLAVLGMGYFGAFSNLEINFILKNYLALIPFQLAALIYFIGFRQIKS